MKNIILCEHFFLFCASLCMLSGLSAQEQQYIVLIPPYQDRMEESHGEGPLQLVKQQFTLFVYKDAVAVYSEAQFKNTSAESVVQEMALPSTNYAYDSQNKRISNGILGVQMRVEEEKVVPNFIVDGDEEWYTINLELGPSEQKEVISLFWAQTSLTDVDSLPGLDSVIIADGKRGFIVDLSHAAIWNGFIESINVTVILKDGITTKSKSFSADPDTYDMQDSVLTWEYTSIEPAVDNNISVSYSSYHKLKSSRNTMTKLSRYITSKVYDDLVEYVTNKEEE